MGKQRAMVMVCDNPDCGKVSLTSDDEPAFGYYFGAGMWHSGAGGGPLPAIYAHESTCIIPAVHAAMRGTHD